MFPLITGHFYLRGYIWGQNSPLIWGFIRSTGKSGIYETMSASNNKAFKWENYFGWWTSCCVHFSLKIKESIQSSQAGVYFFSTQLLIKIPVFELYNHFVFRWTWAIGMQRSFYCSFVIVWRMTTSLGRLSIYFSLFSILLNFCGQVLRSSSSPSLR